MVQYLTFISIVSLSLFFLYLLLFPSPKKNFIYYNDDFDPSTVKYKTLKNLLYSNIVYENPKNALNKPNPKSLWPKGIVPYRIHPNVDYSVIRNIQKAIEIWENNTCIRFILLPDEQELEEENGKKVKGKEAIFKEKKAGSQKGESDESEEKELQDEGEKIKIRWRKPFVHFMHRRGCTSHVGRQWWNKKGQVISIEKECSNVNIAHEIGHALGLYHEHCRPDRDDFVIILVDNIRPKHMRNFIKKNVPPNDDPYDLNSLMHYGPKAFSHNGHNTIIPKEINKHFTFRERTGLSFYDKRFVNTLYKCNAHCHYMLDCLNGGFINKSCQCVCPPGFSGTFCEKETKQKEVKLCGRNITKRTVITSPSFPHSFPMRTQCVWWVQAKENRTVKAIFKYFNMIPRNKYGFCSRNEFELRVDDIYDGKSYCGQELHRQTITSTSNNMVFLFHSGKYRPSKGGFYIIIKILKPSITDEEIEEEETIDDDEKKDDDKKD